YIVTDRWQRFSDERLCDELLDRLSGYCAEFLVHAVDSEGKSEGIEGDVAKLLGGWGKIPITYAGGIRSLADVEEIHALGRGKLSVTVGSALDIFGGPLSYKELIAFVADK
ncbi:MAG: phosphoribosylformimino-5-aminoimidazole carboxamide ribotide isomerase, partial [Clostridiales bacterium]|nr:phosphoribosylformimino-5-aminoimidazole carboxamide ribotide isomerase [Clostridiales bacterium]